MLCTFKLAALLLYGIYICSSCRNSPHEEKRKTETISPSSSTVMTSHVTPFYYRALPFYNLLAAHPNTLRADSQRERQLFQYTLSLAEALKP